MITGKTETEKNLLHEAISSKTLLSILHCFLKIGVCLRCSAFLVIGSIGLPLRLDGLSLEPISPT